MAPECVRPSAYAPPGSSSLQLETLVSGSIDVFSDPSPSDSPFEDAKSVMSLCFASKNRISAAAKADARPGWEA